MDIHAPLKTIRVKGDGLKPWYNDSIHEARVVCRRIERLYRKSHLEVHRQTFIEKRKHVVRLIQRCKSDYYKDKFSHADQKEIFKLVGSLLNLNLPNLLTTNLPTDQLPQFFCDFFCDKVQNIRSQLDNESSDNHQPDPTASAAAPELNEFTEYDSESIRRIIMKSASKTCMLDAIPTPFLKNPSVLACMLPFIKTMLNRSLQTGIFPLCLKNAIITPVLKKNRTFGQ